VVVEDGVTGVRAARAAGMRVFGYAPAPDAAAALAREGAVVFGAMAALPALIRERAAA